MAVSSDGVKLSATAKSGTPMLLLQMALDRKRVGKEIAALRDARRLTQAKVVEDTGLSLRQVQRYEAGESMPRWNNLDKLADVLGPEVYELVRDEGEAPELMASLNGSTGEVLERLVALEKKMDRLIAALPTPTEEPSRSTDESDEELAARLADLGHEQKAAEPPRRARGRKKT